MIGVLQTEAGKHATRVVNDSGTVNDLVKSRQLIDFYKAEWRLNDIKLLWSAVGGTLVQSGTNPLQVSKAYSADSNRNDLVQGTSLNQPFGVGQIQGLPMGLYNPNGDARFVTHPQISFAANEAWTITLVINWAGSTLTNSNICHGIGVNPYTELKIRYASNNRFYVFLGDSLNIYAFPENSSNQTLGKTSIITFVATGDSLTLYINGVVVSTVAGSSTKATFRQLFASTSAKQSSVCKHYLIQASALTASQVAAEHNLLRSIYPEIPSVVIGSQEWAVDNFRAVATPMGNVIQEMQAASAVEKITNAADREFSSDTGFWTKGTGWTIGSGMANYDAISDVNILHTGSIVISTSKWVKVGFEIKSGTARFAITDRSGAIVLVPYTNYSVGSYTFYIKTSSDITNFLFIAKNNLGGTAFAMDNASIQELGWADATELYNGLIAQGYTVANATKEAAMWCSYNNDPANDAIYGKIFNGYAKNLLYADMVTALFGWNVATKAQLQSIAALGGDVLRVAGTGYWTTDRGNNSSQFYAIGGAMRNPDGTFATLRNSATFWAGDAIEAMTIQHDSDTVTVAATGLKAGHSIRLTKL